MTIIDIVSIVRTLSGAEKLGEQSNEENTKTGHTGADNTDIDFDCRPPRDGQVVPRWVVRLREMEKGLEA
jgi:hypothetical protein